MKKELLNNIIKMLLGAFIGCMVYDYVYDVDIEEKITYITKYDTIVINKPKYDTILQTKYIKEKFIVLDTIKDSVYIEIPITTKVYSDSLFNAQISGYHAQLDYIEVYPKTIYKTHIKTINKSFNFGVQAGGGLGYYDSKIIFTPYLGVGISYNF